MEFIDSDVGAVREPPLLATKDRSGLHWDFLKTNSE